MLILCAYFIKSVTLVLVLNIGIGSKHLRTIFFFIFLWTKFLVEAYKYIELQLYDRC